MSHSDEAPLSVLYNVSSLSPLSLSPLPPPPISSRNWSGSGSCRSMEIWVHTVYVIVASINALLICSGLQPSIHIIHLHALQSPKLLLHTCTHIWEKNTHGLADRERNQNTRKKTTWAETGAGRTTNRMCVHFLVCVRSRYLNIRVLIGYRYTSAHLHTKNCQLEQQRRNHRLDKNETNSNGLLYAICKKNHNNNNWKTWFIYLLINLFSSFILL